MLRNLHVLFPTDFSAHADMALPYALALARRFEGTLHIVHVIDTNALAHGSGQGFWLGEKEMGDVLDSMQEHAESRLALIIDRGAELGIHAEAMVTRGQVVAQILDAARLVHAGLVVVPSHGRTGIDRLVFGSVCERVIRNSPAPVLTIKHPEREFVHASDMVVRLNRVLFPTDFSDFSLKGLAYAAALCREFDAELILAHVAEMPLILPELMPEVTDGIDVEQVGFATKQLEAMADGLHGIRTRVEVRRGHAPHEVVAIAGELEADLIVVPTHGRSGVIQVFWGSVSEKVTRLARCPVLVVRPQAQDLAVDESESARAPA